MGFVGQTFEQTFPVISDGFVEWRYPITQKERLKRAEDKKLPGSSYNPLFAHKLIDAIKDIGKNFRG